MVYTILGKTGLKVSRLGFGCMRFTMKGDVVDREQTIPLLHKALELGINYYDTAVFYCNNDSQKVLGEAFEKMRDRIILSTKNHHYESVEGWRKNLEDSLRYLRTDHIDIYNFHALNLAEYNRSVKLPDGLMRQMIKAKEEGLIRHICCSFHDTPENLIRLADEGVFETITLQYNLIDRSNEEAIRYLYKKNIGVVVMGPVGGGRLGGYYSDQLGMRSAQLALSFVLSNPGVNVAISGMSDMKMLEENVSAANSVVQDGRFAEAVLKNLDVRLEKMKHYYCTACRYCMPCPHGVDIPENITHLICGEVFDLTEPAKKQYKTMKGKGALCASCKVCLEKCPQKLNIPALMQEAMIKYDERFGEVLLDFQQERAPVFILDNGQIDALIEGKVAIKNLSDKPLRGNILVRANGQEIISRRNSAIGVFKSTKRRVVFKSRLEYPYSVKFVMLGVQDKEITKRFVPAARIKGPEFWNVIGESSYLEVGSQEQLKGHGMRFALSYTEKELIFKALVKDDCKGLVHVGETGPFDLTDCVELFLSSHRDEVGHRLVLYPGLKDKGTPFAKCVQGEVPPEQLSIASEFTNDGYQLTLSIGKGAICSKLPSFLKMDVVQCSADEDKKCILRVEFGGYESFRGDSSQYPVILWETRVQGT
jgi:predicted aldo/keto reductase-like oxidoreductase